MAPRGSWRRRDASHAAHGPGVVQAWATGRWQCCIRCSSRSARCCSSISANDTQAGLYGIALSVMTAIYLIPVTIYQKFLLAKLHRWSAHDKPKFWMVYRKGNLACSRWAC